MIESLKVKVNHIDENGIDYEEPTICEIRQKINEIVEHINVIEGAVVSLIDPEEKE